MVTPKQGFTRISRTEYFINIAKEVAKRSTCPRAQVGAVLVYNNHIVSTGFNGSPPGVKHCIDEGCLMHNGHCIRTIHAEINAILNLEHSYSDLILYCTHMPCYDCYKALVTAKVSLIIYANFYEDLRRNKLIEDGIYIPMKYWRSIRND